MRRPVLPLLLLAALLSGCTSGDDGGDARPEGFRAPPAAEFREGTCALVAEDLRTVGRIVRDLETPTVEPEVRTELQDAQQVLARAADAAEPDVAEPLRAVVTRTGLVRLALDAERYEVSVAEPLAESFAQLVAACTGDRAATATVPTG